MTIKKVETARLKNTLNELDSALEQWDSITNKPADGQAPSETEVQQRAKNLLKQLREQLNEFETQSTSSGSDRH